MAGGTNFEAKKHEELKAMVESTDPAKVLSRGSQLQAAGKVLKELSGALKAHVDQISWEGPAAEEFKTWAGNFHKSAALLGDYSTGAGDAMHQAGEALSTAKTAVPPLPQTEIDRVAKHKNQSIPYIPADFETRYGVGSTVDSVMKQSNPNWVTTAEAQQAAKKVEQEHQEAVNQMVKLAQAYEAATTKLNSLEPPSLPGTPVVARTAPRTSVEVAVVAAGRAPAAATATRTAVSAVVAAVTARPSGVAVAAVR